MTPILRLCRPERRPPPRTCGGSPPRTATTGPALARGRRVGALVAPGREAVIVPAARSPIGRARKGSLAGMRPDDLTVQMVRAALDQVPALDPTEIDDLMLGCGLPGGEQGNNMGRIVSVLLGLDTVPGTTITRYCS